MKKAIRISLPLLLSAFLLTGCVNKFKQIEVTDFRIESVIPSGLRNYTVNVALDVNNPAPSFKIQDIEALVKQNGSVIGLVTAEPLAIDGKCERTYRFPLQAQFADNLGMIQILTIAKTFNPDEFTVDVKARAYIGEIGKNIEYIDLPVSKYVKK